jgi:hypothetical protein
LPVLLGAAIALFTAGSALAVHDLEFQLDGDVLASTTTNVGPNGPQALDWDSLFTAAGTEKALPTNFTASGFDRDFRANPGCTLTATGSFCTADQTTFATGSKDTLNITPGWQCNFDANVNSKIDIMNAYAAAYTNPDDGHQILYFGLERNANTGDGNVAFWFLQSNADCASTGGSAAWTGDHVDGDLLIVSAFTKGGGVSGIDVYRWDGGAGGSLNPNSVAHGVDCKTTLGGDSVCATTNSGPDAITGTISTPWLTSNKQDGVGNSLREAEFFEGGLDLTANDLGGKCFNVFVGDTRSSQSLTATLFDYARGQLGECGLSATTTPSGTGTRVLGSTDPQTDLADFAGTDSAGNPGPKPTGSASFFLCGPADVTASGCPDGLGTAVTGNPVTLVDCTPDAAGHACATSGDAQSLITGVGTYCFRVVYNANGDTNYSGFDGNSFTSASECFTVTAVASTSTHQTWIPNDTATVTASGGATVQGNVTWVLYVGSSTCTTGTGVTTYNFGPIDVVNGSASTNNPNATTSVILDANTVVSWKATFHSTNSVGSGSPSPCETSSIANLNNG